MGAKGSKEKPRITEGGDSAVLSRLEEYRPTNKLNKFAMMVIAKSISTEEIQRLKAMLEDMDKDGNGIITYHQLKTGFAQLGSTLLTEDKLEQLMKGSGVDGNMTINYKEFIATTIRRHKFHSQA